MPTERRGTLQTGDEFGWTTLGGTPHYGRVVEIDSNVIYIDCAYHGRKCCCEGRPEDFGEAPYAD